MEILPLILKAMLIGALGSIPVGPIVMLTLQRSISGGKKAGMSCAIGAILSDTIFATLALFAFKLVSELLEKYTHIIEMGGGIIIAAVGFSMLFQKFHISKPKLKASRILFDSGKSLLMGLSNPGSFFWILASFTAMGFDANTLSPIQSILVIAGVFMGSLLYWFLLTSIAAKGENRFNLKTLLKINRFFGVLIILFGAYFIVKALFLS